MPGRSRFRDLTGPEQSDAAETHAHGPQPPAYAPLLSRCPQCLPGDVEAARRRHLVIRGLLRRGGWTRPERETLAEMAKTWARRAEGLDARYLVVGNRRGRVTDREQNEIDRWRVRLALRQAVRDARRRYTRSLAG